MPFPKRKKYTTSALCPYCRDGGVETNPELGNENLSDDEKSTLCKYHCRRCNRTFPTYIEQ